MVSNLSIFLLGIIKEKPLNAYELIRLLETCKGQDFTKPANSSIYVSLRKLYKQGYIDGDVIRDGHLPEKTIYSITEKGERAFIESIEECLRNPNLDYNCCRLGIIYMYHLSKERVIELLKIKELAINRQAECLEQRIKIINEKKCVTPASKLALKESMFIIKGQRDIVYEMLNAVNESDEWSPCVFHILDNT